MLESLVTAFLFAFGLLFGSFLNVVIHRLPRAESETSTWWVGYRSLVHPRRSHCPHCGHAIRWFENVPVVSWLALRGRCASCRAPISPRYVLVELMTGLLFVAASVRFGLDYALLPALVMVLLVVPLIFIDAEHWILPFELTLPGIAAGVSLAVPLGLDAVLASVLGAVGGFVAFRLMEYLGWLLFHKEALGAGDKYLLAMLGAFLGWRPLIGVLFLSSLQGAFFGVASLLLRGRAGPAVAQPNEGSDAVQLNVVQPNVAQPNADSDVQPNVVHAQPSVAQPDAVQPSVVQPNVVQPNVVQPNVVQPNVVKPNVVQPDVVQPNVVQPNVVQPNVVQPNVVQPNVAVIAQADTAEIDDSEELTFTPDAFKPGVPVLRRLVLTPWTLLFQPIPDDPLEAEDGSVDEWTPSVTSLPFGPWIGLAGLEVLLLTPWLRHLFEGSAFSLTVRLLFGDQ